MTKKFFAAVAAICLSAMCTIAYAVPAKPMWNTMLQPDGTTIQVRLVGDEFFHYYINEEGQTVAQNEEGYWAVTTAAQQSTQAQLRRAKASQGRMMNANKMRKAPAAASSMTKGLIILVNYKDTKFQSGNNLQAFKDMMMDDSYAYNKTYPGSAHKYFFDQSNGQYDPQFDVYGPYTVSKNSSYYAGSDGTTYATTMVKEACQLADNDGVDFSQYDQDKDGKVDFVFIIYAGHGQADYECETCVWPHQYWLSEEEVECVCDGKTVDMYACASELDGNSERAGIATFCHEFSHVLGLADVYDVCYGDNYNKNLTPGDYHLMDGGSYNGDGYCPPNYNAYDKYYVGWATPTVLNTACTVTLPADGTTYRQITSDGKAAAYTKTSNVYYLENRQKSGWDKAIPGSGMLVWRVKYNADIWEANEPNAGKNGEYSLQANTTGAVNYELIVADGKHSSGDDGDPFPGSSKVTTYTPFTAYPITAITEKDSVITFKFMGGEPTNYTVTWNADGVTNTTKVTDGLLTLPADPAKCESEKVFVGWTKATSVDPDGKGLVLAKNGDVVEGDETYYAVYAIEESEDAPIRKAGETSIAYTFSDKSWSSTPANGWTKNADGAGYSNNGIQFTSKNTSGNATSKTSFTNVSKVVVSYCTNAKTGAGTIDITVGSNAKTSLDVTSTGGTTARDLEFSYSTPQSGAITIGATCTTNSIYICGITIYTGSGKTYSSYSLSCVDCETKPEDIKTVTFNYNGNGQANTSFATTCSRASTILPTPNAWAKHNCTGWFDAAEGGNLVGEVGDEYTPSKDITLYAQWEEVPVTVYTVAEVKSEYDKGNIKDNDSIYVKGYITSIQLKPNNFWKYGSAIIWLSDTQGTSKDMQLYNCYGLMGDTLATFDPYQESGSSSISVTSVTDRSNLLYEVGDFIEAYGSFKLYNTTYELNSGCYITKGGKIVPSDVENAVETSRPKKFIENGMLIIERDGVRYSITGAKLQ